MLGRQDRCRVGASVDLMSEDAHDQVRALRKVAVHSPDWGCGDLDFLRRWYRLVSFLAGSQKGTFHISDRALSYDLRPDGYVSPDSLVLDPPLGLARELQSVMAHPFTPHYRSLVVLCLETPAGLASMVLEICVCSSVPFSELLIPAATEI